MEYKDLMIKFLENRFNKTKGITIIESEKIEKFISYEEIYKKSCKYLSYIQSKGIKKGDKLLFQVNEIDKFICIFWACQLGGITAVPLEVGDTDESNVKMFRIWKTLNRAYLLSNCENLEKLNLYKDNISEDIIKSINKRFLSCELLDYHEDNCIFNDNLKDDYIALIQFSSGSTGIPKGVPIKYSSLSAQINDLIKRQEITKNDITLNWTPLTHCFGLIVAHIVSTFSGINQYLMSKKLFVKNPTIWMDKASEHKATILYSPNFGYKYLLTFLNDTEDKGWDLSNVRILLNGAEPVNYELCYKFLKYMSKYKLRDNCISPGYGCSEAVCAVSLPLAGEELKIYKVDKKSLSLGEKVEFINSNDQKEYVNLVAVGFPLDNCKVRFSYDDNELEDLYIGNVELKGKTVISDYYNNEDATSAYFNESGWFKTGDLGFKYKGRIIITGREKEIIIVNGKNYFPYDIERIIEEIEEVPSSQVAVCGVFNEDIQTDEICIFIKNNDDLKTFFKIAEKVKNYVSKKLGLYIANVLPVKEICKTESGKIKRLKMKQQFIDGKYNEVINQMKIFRNEKAGYIIENTVEEVQNNLLKIWEEILGTDEIGIDDNFFDIGGSSNMLVIMNSKINNLYKGSISTVDIFEAPTIEKLSQLIIKNLKQTRKKEKMLVNKLPSKFYNTNNITEIKYEIIEEDLSEFNNIEFKSLLLSVYLKLISNIIENNKININIIYSSNKFVSLMSADMNELDNIEEVLQSIQSSIELSSKKLSIKDIEVEVNREEVSTIFSFNEEENQAIGLNPDILIWFNSYKNKLYFKIKAQHQNVFLTALSCQGTFITF